MLLHHCPQHGPISMRHLYLALILYIPFRVGVELFPVETVKAFTMTL